MMRRNKMMKRVLAGMLTAVMLLAGAMILPETAKAAEMAEGDKVCYEEMSATEFGKYYSDETKVAPTKEGYLFGGWYLDKELTNPVTAKSDVTGTVYAKFVPAYVLSVKAQNYASTTEGKEGTTPETNKTTTRVVSSVDESLLYSEVGFKVKIQGKDEVTVNTTKVWGALASGADQYEATQIFGEASKYFFVLNVTNIPEAKWGEAIYVRPYWKTEDGTKVEGLGKYVYTEDGVKGYISVPINLNNVLEGMAAGVLKVSYDESLTFVESVGGRVFDEMEVNPQSSFVTCVGNVTTLADVQKDDMYITLRFQLPSEVTLGEKEFYKFIVSDEDFASIEEDDVTFNVWDVQY